MRPSLPVRVLSFVALACLLVATSSRSEEPAKDPAGEAKDPGKHCREAVDKLCPDSRPGSVERRACVRENADKLPADCQAAMRRRAGPPGVAAMLSACEADIAKHCADVRRGGGRIARCLEAVDAKELTSACQEQLAKMGGRRANSGAGAPPEAPSD